MKKYLERDYLINITSNANIDIEDIYNYIRNDSVYYAIKTENEILDRIISLSDMPFKGKKIINSENIKILNLREIIYKSYRIIYSVNLKTIYVRRVLHSARLLSTNLIKI